MDDKSFSIDEMGNYQFGSGGSYLKDWKENRKVILWFPPYLPILHPWFHWIPRVLESKKKGEEGTTNVVGVKHLCIENEKKVLKRRRQRKDDGSLFFPPCQCPNCKMVEWMLEQVETKKIDWLQPVFKYEATEDERTVYAGGLCGLFDKNKLKKRQKKEVKDATGLGPDEFYQQEHGSSQMWVLCVVQHEEMDDGGVMIAEEKVSVVRAMDDAVKAYAEDKGKAVNMKTNPRAIVWQYNPKKDGSDKYTAVVRQSLDMPSHVKEVFDGQEMPDLSFYSKEPNWADELESLQQACLINDMPLEQFFDKVDTTKSQVPAGEDEDESEDEVEEDEDDDATESDDADEAEESEEKSDAEEDDEDEVDSACAHCGHDMGETTTCEKCGTEYEYDDDAEDYVIKSRPCANPDCMEKAIILNYHTGLSECPQCGTTHTNTTWEFELKKVKGKKKASKKKTSKKTEQKTRTSGRRRGKK